MELYPIDNDGLVFVSPDIDDWTPILLAGIKAIIDLDGDLDIGVPFMPNELVYIYFPFDDRDLPDLNKLHVIARLAADLVRCGYPVLSHCKMGHNRSALLAGVILTYLGLSGEQAFELLHHKLVVALYNLEFASYLLSLPAA